jgi:hypothetical protein
MHVDALRKAVWRRKVVFAALRNRVLKIKKSEVSVHGKETALGSRLVYS